MNIDCPTFLRRYRIEVGIACAFLIGLVAHSTIAGAQPADEASHTLPLVTPASHPGRQGFVRIINRSDDSGAVRIHAIDDAGERFGPVSLSLDAQQTRHFTSQALETGNASRGLSGGVEDGSGNWRLELSTALDIEALAYIRTPDVMSSIHEVAAEEQDDGSTRYRYHVPFFNPGSNRTRRSWLRLVNPGQSEARIVISARDDGGAPAESDVRLTLPGGAARALSAQQLEAGGSEFEGRFGDGTGKWQLSVSTDHPLLVMSLLESPTGNLTNLSSPGASPESVTPPRPTRVVDLANLSPAVGFVIQGDEWGLFDSVGGSVSSAGDVNNDGYDDVIVGAPGADGWAVRPMCCSARREAWERWTPRLAVW